MSKKIIASHHSAGRGEYRSYVTGFLLSVILTLIPFVIVTNRLIWGWALVFVLLGFAMSQLAVQLKFFIHLGYEQKPYWNKIVFLFMLLILIIIVAGTLWIMKNLDYNMTHSPTGGRLPDSEGF